MSCPAYPRNTNRGTVAADHSRRKNTVLRLVLLLFCLQGSFALADVVKPALIEISVNTNGTWRIEIRASIEALLTGINARYKNTRDAPNAEAYDELRGLAPADLAKAFTPFKPAFTDQLELAFDGQRVPLTVTQVDIPEPGYTKVPRISVIYLEGTVDRSVASITWYYPERFGDNAVRVRQVDNSNEKWHWSDWQWLRNDAHSESFSLTEVFTRQPALTLGLSMAGLISLPANIVEPLIALSIAYIGIENITAHSLHKSRLVIVFCFGLLHGMGFASVLSDFGMPAGAFLTALVSFNVGVELGQLAVILLAFFAVGLWFRNKPWYRRVIVIPCSLAIAVTGLYWTWDRIVL